MEYESIFNFLENKKGFKDIYSICIQFEKSIINQCYNTALMAARVISEKLIIKLALTNNDIRKRYLIKEDSQWKIKRDYNLETVILQCYNAKPKIIDYDIKEDYFSIKGPGNLNSHGINISQFGLKECVDAHKLIFNIALDCFNNFEDKQMDYYYNLDEINVDKRFTSDEVFNFLKNIHENEINKNNFIDFIKSKKIFFTIDYFKDYVNQFVEYLDDDETFEVELKNYKWIDDSNIQGILNHFDISIKKELFSNLTKKSEENLNHIINILDKQPEYLTIKDIDDMLNSSNDDEKVYYESIKKLSENFFVDALNEIINELNNVLVKETDDETKEIINKLKSYKTDNDGYFFTIRQVDEHLFLDKDQRAAVKYWGDKPLIINAGPGSGKTRVITERVRFLVKEKNVDPSSILVITFTNEATNELKNRLKYKTDLDINVVNKMRISTIHSFCRYLISKYEDLPYNYLNRYGERGLFIEEYKDELGFNGYYSIFGSDLSTITDKYDHYFSFGINTRQFSNYIRNKHKVTNDYKKFIDEFYEKTGGHFPTFNQINRAGYINQHYYAKYERIIESYPKYKELLEDNKSCDDNYLLEKGYEILSNFGTDYKNILIDEFQDTDYHLKKIVDRLQENCSTFTIVGDLDQSIYGFRGAIPKYFEEYINNKEDNEYVELHTNYRSSRDIIEFNEEFIKNKRDVQKELKPKKQYHAPVYHLSNVEEADEFNNLIYIIKNLKSKNKIKYYSDVLVLFKSHTKINNFVKELELYDIPYYIDKKRDFLDQNEIKSILTLYWYLLDFDEFNLQYNQKKNDDGNTFLNFYGFTDKIYDASDFFKLSEDTQQVLIKIQNDYEEKIINAANELYFENKKVKVRFNYVSVFDQDIDFIKTVVANVKKESLIELDDSGLINLGITNQNDRKFFLKLRELKSQMNNPDYTKRPTTLTLFKEFITMTNFYSEISLKNSEDALKITKDISLLSNIIKDYENIRGNRDYLGLFNYLNGVLKSYSSAASEMEDEMDKVHVRTIHSSKGLEYPIVIIGSLGTTTINDKKYSFPNILLNNPYGDYQTIDHYPFPTPIRFLEHKPKDFKSFNNSEEYRKIYVGATRAKEILILSTIGDIPSFIKELKKSEINFELLEAFDVDKIKKVQSSKIINKRSLISELNFEKIAKDYLFCPFRYNLSNNLKLELDISDNNYVDMVVHNLLENIHSQKDISRDDVNSKIKTCIDLHNVSSNEESLNIISNIMNYWDDEGFKYEILYNNVPVAISLENCELNGEIDLIIQGENNKISLVKFICTDKRIDEETFEFYHLLYHFYPHCLKEYDEFKDVEFDKIIVYSLSDNNPIIFDYVDSYEDQSLELLESVTVDIFNAKFEQSGDCSNCEYNNNFCKNN